MSIEVYSLIKVAFVFLVGACFGSFVTMASYRIPRQKDMFFTRSFCPECRHILQWTTLIPILSYIFQNGKCKYCRAKISLRYITTEFITAFLFVVVYLKFGISYNSVLVMLLVTSLMILIITDLENYIIPDSIQIFMLITSVAYNYINNVNFVYCMISGIVYMLIGIALYYSFLFISKKEPIGIGDIKFMGISGLFLGINVIGAYMFVAGFLGTIFGLFWIKIKNVKIFPFGPALATSLFVCLMFHEEIEILFGF